MAKFILLHQTEKCFDTPAAAVLYRSSRRGADTAPHWRVVRVVELDDDAKARVWDDVLSEDLALATVKAQSAVDLALATDDDVERRDSTGFLRKAIVTQAMRGQQYDQSGDNRERSMARVVEAFNIIYGTSLTEYQGWKFMEIVKLVRGSNKPHEDSELDCVSYAALAAEARMAEVE